MKKLFCEVDLDILTHAYEEFMQKLIGLEKLLPADECVIRLYQDIHASGLKFCKAMIDYHTKMGSH